MNGKYSATRLEAGRNCSISFGFAKLGAKSLKNRSANDFNAWRRNFEDLVETNIQAIGYFLLLLTIRIASSIYISLIFPALTDSFKIWDIA